MQASKSPQQMQNKRMNCNIHHWGKFNLHVSNMTGYW